MSASRGGGVRLESKVAYGERTGFLGAGYPVRFFPAVRATAAEGGLKDRAGSHWQGIRRGKNEDPTAGSTIYTHVGTSGSE